MGMAESLKENTQITCAAILGRQRRIRDFQEYVKRNHKTRSSRQIVAGFALQTGLRKKIVQEYLKLMIDSGIYQLRAGRLEKTQWANLIKISDTRYSAPEAVLVVYAVGSHRSKRSRRSRSQATFMAGGRRSSVTSILRRPSFLVNNVNKFFILEWNADDSGGQNMYSELSVTEWWTVNEKTFRSVHYERRQAWQE